MDNFYPASFAESQIWLAESLSDIPNLFWIEEEFALPEYLDKDRFHIALERVFQRHLPLHQYFLEIDGVLFKKTAFTSKLPLYETAPSISLFEPPLIQFILKSRSLYLRAHHTIFDANSLVLFFKELDIFYKNPDTNLDEIVYESSIEGPPPQYISRNFPILNLPIKQVAKIEAISSS